MLHLLIKILNNVFMDLLFYLKFTIVLWLVMKKLRWKYIRLIFLENSFSSVQRLNIKWFLVECWVAFEDNVGF